MGMNFVSFYDFAIGFWNCSISEVFNYEKNVKTVMDNNFIIINKTNNHLSYQTIEHKKDHDIFH